LNKKLILKEKLKMTGILKEILTVI
jgi:hypothetical protein